MAIRKVVIPENTETCRSLWYAATREAYLLAVFPGILEIPRGILGELESDEFHQKAGVKDNQRIIVLSNGWTVTVPTADVQLL